jgi:hypothetical protein
VFTITNNNPADVNLSQIILTWDEGTVGELKTVLLDGKNLGFGNNKHSPATIPLPGEADTEMVEGGTSEQLVFTFDPGPASGTFTLEIEFSFGCSLP